KITTRQENVVCVTHTRQSQRHEAQHQQEAEDLIPPGAAAGRIVEVQAVGDEQHNRGHCQDLEESALDEQFVIELQQPVFPASYHCSQYKRSADDQRLDRQQHQGSRRVIDFE